MTGFIGVLLVTFATRGYLLYRLPY